MALLLGPVIRNVSLAARKEVISWLIPKILFYIPTVAAFTTTCLLDFCSLSNSFYDVYTGAGYTPSY
jgi:hypothetical protein